jgi:DNA-binding MltR family transcriptional regulator
MASALKKLITKRPTVESINEAMRELDTDGPRGAVILGSALVEDVLRAAILYHMNNLSSAEYDQLFSATAPLGSFSGKAKIAYAFGLIGPKTRDDLDSLRELRNAFAHAHIVFSFESKEVSDKVRKLNCVAKLTDKDSMEIRKLFRTAVRVLLIHLISKIDPEMPGLGDDIRNLG